MKRAKGTTYARAGLLGNPSDGYGGKAIAIPLFDFRAQACLEPGGSNSARGSLSQERVRQSLLALASDSPVADSGDGTVLLEAAWRTFLKAFPEIAGRGAEDPCFRFSIRFETDIPRQVGLAGSSAIVISVLRALCQWFVVEPAPETLAEWALSAETLELGIAAGPMDRVVQAREAMVMMDLAEPGDCSSYRVMDEALLPELFLVWDPRGGQPSGVAHGDLRRRWERADPEVMSVMAEFRDLVDRGLGFLESGDFEGFRRAMNQNFDLRSRIFNISERDREMVEMARGHGAGAKLCGSGGAVLGSPRRASDFETLQKTFREKGYRFLRPRILGSERDVLSDLESV
jgi:glucuronokinase